MVAQTIVRQNQHQRDFNLASDSEGMKRQLVREITCLERHLSRLKHRDETLSFISYQTYEEMIATRRSMLESLPASDYQN